MYFSIKSFNFHSQDVFARLMSFSQVNSQAVCVISANGTIGSVTLLQSSSCGGTVSYEVCVRLQDLLSVLFSVSLHLVKSTVHHHEDAFRNVIFTLFINFWIRGQLSLTYTLYILFDGLVVSAYNNILLAHFNLYEIHWVISREGILR